MMNKITKGAIAFYLCLIFVCISATPVLSQSGLGPGVDLIILIDQSNSMFGLGATEEREAVLGTDRDGRRVDTAQYLIDYMAFDNAYVNQNRVNRVLVIAFGSYGREKVVVPLTELDVEKNVQKAKNLVDPLRSPKESLNGTDFISAFERISERFSSDTEDPILSSGLRRRLVVVITDGGPDIRGTRFDDRSEYFEYLREIYQIELGERYPVYVIGIDKNEPPLYWNEVAELWEDSVAGKGNAVRVTDPNEINKQVVKMLCPFLNPTDTGDECRLQDMGNHFILPYARYVSFSFFKYDPSARIELYRPTLMGETGGERVQVEPVQDSDLVEYNKTKSDEFFGLENPRPGCWKSERKGAGKVDVLLQVVFNDLMMTKPSSSHPQVSPLNFKFLLKDTQGNPIDELGDFPVNLEAELIAPDGDAQAISMVKEQPGLYVSKQSALTVMTGTHNLNLVGKTLVPQLDNCLPSSEEFTVFSQTFQIPVYQPSMIVSNPHSVYSSYAPFDGLTVSVVDKNGEPATVDPRLSPYLRISSPSSEERLVEDINILGNSLKAENLLTFPEAGFYTVTASLESPEGDLVFEDASRIETKDPVAVIHPAKDYPAFAPLRFVEVEIQDAKGQPVSVDPSYPLQVEATMTWPNGYSDTVSLAPTAEQGRYQISASWPLTKVATHRLEVSGYTSLSPGAEREPVFVSQQVINVSGNLPYFEVSIPDEDRSDQVYPLHHWFLPPLPFDFVRKPQPIEAELRYGNRSASVEEFFVGDFNNLFHVNLVTADGDVLIEDLPLSFTGKSRFSAEIGQLDEPGAFTALISLDGQLRGDVDNQDIWPDVSVSFQRRDSVAYIVVWIIIGVAIAGAVLYFGGGWLLNRFFLPKAKGKLVAKPTAVGMRSALWDFDVTSQHKNHFTIKEQDIDARLGLQKIEVSRAMPRTRGRESEEGINIVAYNEKEVAVAKGSIYPSRKLTVRQRTSENKSYKFEYEA